MSDSKTVTMNDIARSQLDRLLSMAPDASELLKDALIKGTLDGGYWPTCITGVVANRGEGIGHQIVEDHEFDLVYMQMEKAIALRNSIVGKALPRHSILAIEKFADHITPSHPAYDNPAYSYELMRQIERWESENG